MLDEMQGSFELYVCFAQDLMMECRAHFNSIQGSVDGIEPFAQDVGLF